MKVAWIILFLLAVAPYAWAEHVTTDQLQDAAEHGSADAQYELATNYEFGFSRSKNIVNALAWYMLAAAQGHVLAAKRAVALESRLTRPEVEEAQKLSDRLANTKSRGPK